MSGMQMLAKLRDAKAMLQSAARDGLRSGINTEFEALVRSIGECKSKQEEDRIMAGEIELLKARFSAPGLDKSRAREYMVRAIYVEMLGHDVSWAQVKAMQFASESNIQSKKVTLAWAPCAWLHGAWFACVRCSLDPHTGHARRPPTSPCLSSWTTTASSCCCSSTRCCRI